MGLVMAVVVVAMMVAVVVEEYWCRGCERLLRPQPNCDRLVGLGLHRLICLAAIDTWRCRVCLWVIILLLPLPRTFRTSWYFLYSFK